MKTKLLFVCAALVFALVGCSKKSEVDASKLESSFASADTVQKTQATKAADAIKAGDYSAALASLQSLAREAKLTPEQKAAVNDAIAEVQKHLSGAMTKAAEGGQKAMDDATKALKK